MAAGRAAGDGTGIHPQSRTPLAEVTGQKGQG